MPFVLVKTIATVFAAMCLIVGGDTAGKLLTAAGFSPFFVAWARFAIAAVFLLPLSGLRRAELPNLLDRGILLRAALIAGGISCILTALRTEPIANVFGAFFISPVVSYFLSALLLKEQISTSRTVMLLAGLAGVILVVKPGFGATAGMGFALLAGCLHGSYLVATRWLAGDYRPRFLLVSQLLIGALILSPLAVGAETGPFDATALGLICVSALGSAAGNYLLVITSRSTPASLIAPLIYTQLIAAAVAGYLVFSEWPDAVAFLGLSIILASGLLSYWSARRAHA
ncbi:MAG: DMT family transporter [Paracoccaceae bacterium]